METEGIRRQLTNMNTGGESEQIHHLLLPQEIITEILSKLPVNSLLRFKSVSKSWRFLISSKHLIKTHLEYSKKNEYSARTRIISTTSQFGRSLCTFSLRLLLTKPFFRGSPLDFPINNYAGELCVVGSCNGLICIVVDEYEFWLCNPSTREFKQLPPVFTGLGSITRYGFGFDKSTSDYKVYAFLTRVFDNRERRAMGRMYSLKADSWGREQQLFVDGSPFYAKDRQVGKFVSGKLHWISLKFEIVRLDLKSGTFGLVERLPSCFEGGSYPRLGVLDGCRLCVSCSYLNESRFDIWIWNEYGVEDSWTKFASISYSYLLSPLSPRSSPLCVLPDGDVLFNRGLNFVIYNLKDKRFRESYVYNFDGDRRVDLYTESLVSLASDDDGEYK
ncbi:hypothetical protein ACP275_06G202000 [Erythranthe tilingii]